MSWRSGSQTEPSSGAEGRAVAIPRPSPVPRAFVRGPVVRVDIDEVVEAAHDLVDGGGVSPRVSLEQQDGGQPVGVDPRIPVVDVLAFPEPHPPEVVALNAGVSTR